MELPQQLPQVIRIEYSCRYLLYCCHLCPPLAGPLMQQSPRHLIDNTACSSPDEHRHLTTRSHSNMPKILQASPSKHSILCHVNTGLNPVSIGHCKSQSCKSPGKIRPYQRLICSANALLPPQSWLYCRLQFNAKFDT